MTTLIRWGLSVTLLVFVWMHVHWSVALCLTLLFIGSEGQAGMLKASMRSTAEGFRVINESLKEKN